MKLRGGRGGRRRDRKRRRAEIQRLASLLERVTARLERMGEAAQITAHTMNQVGSDQLVSLRFADLGHDMMRGDRRFELRAFRLRWDGRAIMRVKEADLVANLSVERDLQHMVRPDAYAGLMKHRLLDLGRNMGEALLKQTMPPR